MNWRKKILTGLTLFLAASVWLCSAGQETALQSKTNGDYVVLLHGLIRSSTAMKRLEWAFEEQGYRVINVTYPYTKHSIEDIAGISLAGVLREQIQDPAARIHFVTHSLGGIVLREYLVNNQLTNLGRVVMIAPPNNGSELVDKFRNFPFFKFFTGPAGQQLGTSPESLPRKLGPANFELGVIAGDRTLNPFYSWFIPGPDDGKVSVASTRLEGMDDFIVLHYSHTYLPWRKQVVKACVQFVAEGEFPNKIERDSNPTRSTRTETNETYRIHASPKMQAMR
jgi:pimeloyl-ACP methyl ester carboxylesterase